ncbi:MAG: hypothetical protein NTW14_11950 [bacterium]|nr:hypothetical protein [bacterium]
MNGATAAIIAKKRKHIIAVFRQAHATSPETAQSLEQLGLPDHLLVKIQKLRGVLVHVEGDRYYLDEAREAEVARWRRKIALTVAVLAAISFALMLFLSKG